MFSAKHLWQDFCIALRRVKVDNRARFRVLLCLLGGLYLVSLFAIYFVIIPFYDDVGPIAHYQFQGFICLIGFFGFKWVRKRNTLNQELLNFSLQAGPSYQPKERSTEATFRIGRYLTQRAHILGALMIRGLSESNPDQDHPDLTTRQRMNAQLRDLELWGELEPTEAELMAAPEGTWSDEQRTQVLVWGEQLRLLRWVLGCDTEIVPLKLRPLPNYLLKDDLPNITGEGGVAIVAVSLRAEADVRVERDIANEYGFRLFSELHHRNLIESRPELHPIATEFREKAIGESTDYLSGTQTIADLAEMELCAFYTCAEARTNYANYLVRLLSEDTSLPFSQWSLAQEQEDEQLQDQDQPSA